MSASKDELQFEDTAPAAKPRSNGCLKWFLIFAGIGVVGIIGCCGVGYYLFMPKVVTKPAQVDALAQEIADIKMLPDFKGETGVKMNFYFMEMRFCRYAHSAGKGEFQLTEMSMNGNNAAGNAELEAQMQNQKQMEMKALSVESEDSREIEIRGQSATFTTVFGQDVSSKTKYYQVEGTFVGKHGPAKLMLQVEEEIWNHEAVSELLESLK